MAIGGPEAIDAASLATAAQRRTAPKRLCCFARNGGAAVRGRKACRRRCRIGDRGAADFRPDQPIEEAVWSVRRTETEQRRNWRRLRNQGDRCWHIRPGTSLPSIQELSGHPEHCTESTDIRLAVSPPRSVLRALAEAFRQDDTRSSVRPDRSFPRSVRRPMRDRGRGPIQLPVRPDRSDAFSPVRGPVWSKRALPSPPTASTRSRRRRPRL